MLYFLYGKDSYSIVQRVHEIERAFVDQQKSDFNLAKLDGNLLTASRFSEAAFTPPFLGDRRLIIIKNFLLSDVDKVEKGKIADLLEKIPDENSVVFADDGLPDQRQVIFKRLLKFAEAEHFPEPSVQTLPAWIKQRVTALDGQIDNDAAYNLAVSVGPDLWQLQSEIEKLVLFSQAKNSPIKLADVSDLVPANNSFKIFDLLDALAQKDLKKALLVNNSFLSAGEESFMIFNMIVYQLRNMLVVDDLMRAGKTEQNIAREASLHPYVTSKLVSSLRKFKDKEVAANFCRLAEYDWKMKSGEIEPETALVLLVVQFCGR